MQVLKHDWVVTRGGAVPRLLSDGVAAGAANVAALRRLRNLAHGERPKSTFGSAVSVCTGVCFHSPGLTGWFQQHGTRKTHCSPACSPAALISWPGLGSVGWSRASHQRPYACSCLHSQEHHRPSCCRPSAAGSGGTCTNKGCAAEPAPHYSEYKMHSPWTLTASATFLLQGWWRWTASARRWTRQRGGGGRRTASRAAARPRSAPRATGALRVPGF